MANAFDDIDPPAPVAPVARKPNAFDDIDPPVSAAAPAPVVAPPPPPPPPVAAAPAAPPAPWSITNWAHGGDVTLPQSWQDFGNLAGEQASAGLSLPMARATSAQPLDLPTQLAQLDAARKRLGPTASGVADTLGYYASPTTLLNAIPYAGGGLAGASHEGLKSYFEGGDVPASVLKGGAEGLIGTSIAHVLSSPAILSKLVDAGGTGLGMTAVHGLFGDSPAAAMTGGQMASRWVQPLVKRIEEGGGSLANTLRPYLAAAIQGPASALQQAPGNPWSQWIPGQ